MKLITIASILVSFNFAIADNTTDLKKMLNEARPAEGCLPRRNSPTGNIDGYDCSKQTQNNDLKFEKVPNLKKVTFQKNNVEQIEMYNRLQATTENKPTSADGVKNLKDIMSKNNLSKQTDLSTLLSQLTLKPTKNPKTGRSLFQVTEIEKGSVWEKAGLKIGDLVTH